MSSATLLIQKLEEIKLIAQEIARPVTPCADLWLPVGLLMINNFFLMRVLARQIAPSKYVLVTPILQCMLGLALLTLTKISPAYTLLNAVVLFCASIAIAGSITSMYRLLLLKNSKRPKDLT